ncbi:MAG TPA: magnesium transporter [Polyangiaceae bacterium]|jgi:magnesium transporter|nr:magnesium transporter [Polyangiaceae bacterium]
MPSGSHQFGSELKTLLQENPEPEEVRALVDDVHPEDVADFFDELERHQASELLMQFPTEYAAQVFERLHEDQQQELAETLGAESTAQLALEMDPDDRADFLSVIPPALSTTILREIEDQDPEVAEDVQDLQRWADTSAGGLMTTDYVEIQPEFSIQEAIDAVRTAAINAETIDTVFVTDTRGSLLGVLSLKRLLLAAPDERVSEVMRTHVISVLPELDQEEVARKLAKYDLNTMAVVGVSGKLLGVITADDILDVLTEEQTEDVQKMGALEPIQERYLDTGLNVFLRKRAPWLCVLFMGGFMTTQVLQSFQNELSSVTQLALYLPLLISAGGNSGSQSSTLIIRGLAMGELGAADWWRVFLRELVQGVILGCLLALFGLTRSWLAGDGLHFALLVASTIIGIVILGCVFGGMMPLFLHRLGIDPATSSTPFIASVVDVLGIVVYLSLARVFLGNLMHAAPS